MARRQVVFMSRSNTFVLLVAFALSAASYAADPIPPSTRGAESEWVRLFNGKDLTGWFSFLQKHGRDSDPDHVITIEDGAIHAYKGARNGSEVVMGYIGTAQSFSDYHLRLQYKWGKNQFKPRFALKPDAGIYYHHVTENVVWPQALQFQVELNGVGDLLTVGLIQVDTTIDPGAKRSDWQEYLPSDQGGVFYTTGTGSKVTYTRKLANHEQDGWNTLDLICKSDSAAHLVNGYIVNRCAGIRQRSPTDPDAWIPLTSGRILLEFEATEVFYRDIEIRPLGPKETLDSAVARATGKQSRLPASVPTLKKISAAPPSTKVSTEVVPPLEPSESLKKVHLPAGFKAEIVAAEPLLLDPVAFDWDERGRLWVIEMADYPLGMDGKGKPGGRVRVLDDTDGDGCYDKSTLFADGLNFPNGILTWRNGVIVTAAPNVLFLQDTDGDGKADKQEVLISGLQEGNQQLRANGLRWGLDNWVYLAIGSHRGNYGAETKLKSLRSGQEVFVGARDFRFRPDTGALEPQSGPTQFGRNRDNWGRWFGTQNAHPLWHYALPEQYLRRNPHLGVNETRVQMLTPPNSPPVYPASEGTKRYRDFAASVGHYTSACSGMIYRDQLMFGPEGKDAFVCEPVHNLLQHIAIIDDGVSFTGTQMPGEGKFDFFASEDRWCRPVMVREGPDGALWVADMYRYMIEHPQFLPPEGKAELLPHYRLGDDKGRIYRVSRAGMAASKPLRFDNLSMHDLVAVLDSTNGWRRDKAHQILLWRAEKAALAPLLSLFEQSKNPLARLHALCVLDGLGELQPATIVKALSDEAAGVRENALRLAETRFTPELLAAAVRLVEDKDMKVRMQLAFSLGESKDPAAGEALGRLLIAHADGPLMVAAVMSSATPHLRALVDVTTTKPALADTLLTVALGLNDREAVASLLASTFAANGTRYAPEQLASFARLLDQLARRNTTLGQLRNFDDSLSRLLDKADALLAQSRSTAADALAPALERIAASALLGRDPANRADTLTQLTSWLDPQHPADVQAAAIQVLTTLDMREVPTVFAKAWPTMSPATRQATLGAWMSRETWAFDLIQRLERKEFPASALDVTQRARLIKHDSKPIAALAAKVFDTSHSPRSKIMESYRPVLALKGDPVKGHDIFMLVCAACHKRGTEGRDLGPDLLTVIEHPPEKLLGSILDPSADIQPGFNPYTCTLNTGEQLYGLLASETATSVVVKLADGTRKTVLRNQIKTLQSQPLSLMPEGMEAIISHQQMADLIQFLRTPVTGR
jgi:putative membrane-bound dehydrogenase-like protein